MSADARAGQIGAARTATRARSRTRCHQCVSRRQSSGGACRCTASLYEQTMDPVAAARASLLGLAVGDAFGSMLDDFGADLPRKAAKRLISMKRPWKWTDDTAMA